MQKFQTEISQLLNLIIHSLYSNKEIFLREIISNSSDAIDKLKFLVLTDEKFKNISTDYKINIHFSEENNTIKISDNGIGMDKRALNQNLGTIARSGTKKFVEKLTGDAKKDSNLIGQFGVGFYSAFMVSNQVEVVTKKAGTEKALVWKSDGKSGYTIDSGTREEVGTDVIIHLNDEGKEFVNRWKISEITKKYSNHVAYPIFLHYTEETGEDDKKKIENKIEQINEATAFWKKQKSSLKKKQHNEFYKSLSGDFEDPMFYIHTQAEGVLDYTTLFYIPQKAPMDLFRADYKSGLKLYVKRVFITDDDKELMPTYLRFLRGVIDSEDLPLNVSREILQKNKIMSKIKSNSVKKVLSEIEKLSKKNDKYVQFIDQFGQNLKEGLYQDFENRDVLLELVRFKSNQKDGYVSFKDYVVNMNKDQKGIYYLTGDNIDTMKNSPLLEAYKKKNIEVLLLCDEIDEIIITSVPKYKDYDLKAINRSDAIDEFSEEKESKKSGSHDTLLKNIKKVLKDRIKDVKVSSRLSDSPCCIVLDSNDPSVKMQEMMKAMGQPAMGDIKPIFEVNPKHSIIKKLSKMKKIKSFDNTVNILFNQSLLMEGIKIDNPNDYVKNVNEVLSKAL